MPKAFFFSGFRENTNLQLHGWTGPIRKVGHSAMQGATNMKTGFMSTFSQGKAHAAVEVGNKVAQAGGYLGAVAGGLALAGSGAAWVAAVGGPQVAITAGVVALAVLVKDTYSNREAAHEKLRPFVYNLIDDTPPTNTNYQEAAGPAAYLLEEGKAQVAQMGQKLKEVEGKFEAFWTEYGRVISVLIEETSPGRWKGEEIMAKFNNRNSMAASQRGAVDWPLQQLVDSCNLAQEKSNEMLEKSKKQGGAVFEFVRRLEHVGNYLQCAKILDRALFANLGKGGISTAFEKDSLKEWQGATYYRERMLAIGSTMERGLKNFAILKTFYQINASKIGT